MPLFGDALFGDETFGDDMSCLVRLDLATIATGSTTLPGVSGYGDINASSNGDSNISYQDLSTTTLSSGRVMPILRFVDQLAGAATYQRFDMPAQVTGAWSMRFYIAQNATNATTQPIVQFRNGTTQSMYLVSGNQTRFGLSGIGLATAATPSTGTFRIEIQCDPARSPKFVMRIYLQDSTTVLQSWSGNPTDTTFDNFRIGHWVSGFYPVVLSYGDIEVHDTYDLGGQFTSNPTSPTGASTSATGVPAVNPTVASQYNYDAATKKTLPAATLVSGTDYTTYSGVDYTTAGTFDRKVNLYVPTGTPPAGGWPVVVWAHGGFFVTGARGDLPSAWRDDLLANGYAVASVEYVLSTLDVSGGYDAYGTPNTDSRYAGGRHPSHIVDFKRAAAWLRDNAATYSLDPTKMIASGYSAGGYIALGAAVSTGLTADGDGNPMTIAGATTAGSAWGDSYSGADPVFVGCIVYNAPTDLNAASAHDPTFNTAGSNVNAGHRAYQGASFVLNAAAAVKTAYTIPALIGLNAANVPPIAYVRGTADQTINWEQEDLLADACTTAGVDYTPFSSPNPHEKGIEIYDRDLLVGWLDDVSSDGSQDLVGVGIASSEAHGLGTIQTGPVNLAGVGIASGEAHGLGTVSVGTVNLTGVGIASSEAHGLGTIAIGPITLTGVGIPTGEAHGLGTITVGALNLAGVGIASGEAHGLGVLTATDPGAENLQGVGIPSGEAHGLGTVTLGAVNLTGVGIASLEAHGLGSLTVALRGVGIASAEAHGLGTLFQVDPTPNTYTTKYRVRGRRRVWTVKKGWTP